jgi:predicted small metal-binding protein
MPMKIVDCGKVNPASGCGHIIEAENEEELMKLVAEHAKTHGLEPTPELIGVVRQNIETR